MSGFLDDKLYEAAIKKQIDSTDDFKDLINELYKICEDHWKPQVKMNQTSKKDVKILLDRTFNSWVLFVKRMIREHWFLSDYLEKYSYRQQFMSNDKLKAIYDGL